MSRADPSTSNRLGPAPSAERKPRSTAKGDLPEAVLDRYLIERDRQGRPERFFRDHRAAEPMFRDRGGSLVSAQAYPDAVADMLKIARHRGWNQVRVTGDPAFRREVWIQAQALGLEVRGHRPRARSPGRRPPADEPLRPRPGRTPRAGGGGGGAPCPRSGRPGPPDRPRLEPCGARPRRSVVRSGARTRSVKASAPTPAQNPYMGDQGLVRLQAPTYWLLRLDHSCVHPALADAPRRAAALARSARSAQASMSLSNGSASSSSRPLSTMRR